MQIREKIARRAAKAGLAVSDDGLSGLETYFDLLRKWNRRVSLTSLPVEEVGDEAVDRLLIEPLLAAKHLPRPDGAMIDIGSGGGSPAIPMKLIAPRSSMLMVESKTRKAAFLRDVIRQLALKDTNVASSRFQELLSRPLLHDSADVVTLRAIKVDPKTLVAIQSFVKPGGFIFLFAGMSNDDLRPTPLLIRAASYPLLNHRGSRLQVFEKIAET